MMKLLAVEILVFSISLLAVSTASFVTPSPPSLFKDLHGISNLGFRMTFDQSESALSSSDSDSLRGATSEPPKPPVKCPDCDLCDGSGRIEGGIGVILKWWPIKAYRPCPNFIDRGGFYQRSGQGLDEIAFGRDSTFEVEK